MMEYSKGLARGSVGDLRSAIAHELGHAADVRQRNDTFKKKKDVPNEHDTRPSETYADLMEFRDWLYRTGIYDSRKTEPFTEQHYERAMKAGIYNGKGVILNEDASKSVFPKSPMESDSKYVRILQQMPKDALIEMMNTIAYNPVSEPQEVNYAANGGPLDRNYLNYPVVQEDWADEYFKNNPNVAGMAIGGGMNGVSGDRRIVLRNGLTDLQKESVTNNESYRHYFDEYNITLPRITRKQRNAYRGTSYEGLDDKIMQTEAARYLSGDPSHHMTKRQIKKLKRTINE